MCLESRPGCLARVCVADVNAESCLHELDKRCDCIAGSAARVGERAVSVGVGRDDGFSPPRNAGYISAKERVETRLPQAVIMHLDSLAAPHSTYMARAHMRLAGSQLIPQFQRASLSITRYTSPLPRCPTIRPPYLHPPISHCERGQNAACTATKQTCVEHSDFTQDTKLLPLQCALTKRAGHFFFGIDSRHRLCFAERFRKTALACRVCNRSCHAVKLSGKTPGGFSLRRSCSWAGRGWRSSGLAAIEWFGRAGDGEVCGVDVHLGSWRIHTFSEHIDAPESVDSLQQTDKEASKCLFFAAQLRVFFILFRAGEAQYRLQPIILI